MATKDRPPASDGLDMGLTNTNNYASANLLKYGDQIVEELEEDGEIHPNDLEPGVLNPRAAQKALEPLEKGGVLEEQDDGTYALSDQYTWNAEEFRENLHLYASDEL